MPSKGRFTWETRRFALPRYPNAQLVHLCDQEGGIRVGIVPEDGGEIASIQVRLRGKWHEILYRALDYRSAPPDGWEGRAPLLWPAVGRSFTADQIERWRSTGRKPAACQVSYDGKARTFPGHGFARKFPWRLEQFGCGRNGAFATCSLRSSQATLKMYPFEFSLVATYRLAVDQLAILYEVYAGDNRGPMPFAIGNHVSFVVPFAGRGGFDECTIRAPATKVLLQNDLCLLSGKSRAVDLSRGVPLARSELLDVVTGGYLPDGAWVELNDPSSLCVRVSHSEKSTPRRYAQDENIFFVFWGSRSHGYFCPEPWIGRPNALNTRRGCVLLPPGERFLWEIRFAFQRRLE